MGTICWVGIQISCSDWLCWSAVQHLLQLRQRLDIMAVAMVDMDMVAIVDMEDMDMAVVSMVVDTLEREMLTLNPRLMLDIMEDMATMDMVDMDMAVVSMVVDTLEREMRTLNPRLMLDIMEDMATVDMVDMEDMDMVVVTTLVRLL